MKKILKSKIFWLGLAIIIILISFGFYQFQKNKSKVEYTTETVKRGRLVQTVTATGNVESAHEIDLNFKATGRLAYLPYKEGSKVKAGQELARLESNGLSALVEQYRANLASAQADFARVKAGASAEDVNYVQEKLAKSENDLANLKMESEIQIKAYREKVLDAVNNSLFTSSVAIDKVYNNLINDNLTSNLQVNDNSLANQVESEYHTLKNDYEQTKAQYQAAYSQKTSETVIDSALRAKTFLTSLSSFLNNAYTLADKIILNTAYPQATKDTIKTDVNTQQTANNTALIAVETAKANLENAIGSYASDIKAAENTVSINEAELALKQAGPRNFEINSAQAKVDQARAQLNKALADLNDYVIRAPIDGTITKTNFNLGEQTSLSEPVIKMLSPEKFEIKVDIPESDVAKIKLGDRAVIELDAFGSDRLFFGKISFVEPAKTVIQDVVYYKTTISFDENNGNEQLKSGMTADVTGTTAEKEDVLYVSQRAVRIRETILGEVPEKYAEILINNTVEEKTVVAGLRADNGLVEVISGLIEGDLVVTFKKNGK
ncbi:MAG: efflux RND transporter periplasmic adaptor subunit [Patescibacteria group bacterium]